MYCCAGAGQQALSNDGEVGTDASGNRILKDIGTHLRDLFKKSFKAHCAYCACWAAAELSRAPLLLLGHTGDAWRGIGGGNHRVWGMLRGELQQVWL